MLCFKVSQRVSYKRSRDASISRQPPQPPEDRKRRRNRKRPKPSVYNVCRCQCRAAPMRQARKGTYL